MRKDIYESPLSSRYASEYMLHLFSPDMRFQTWRRLWVALARAEHELGLPITQEQVDELAAHITDIDYEVAEQREHEVRHDVMAHVYAYGKAAPSAAGIIHLGATSCYVTDNADLVLYRDGLKYLRRQLLSVMVNLAAFAREYAATPTLGYTHYQPAQPVTIGKRATLWMQDFRSDLEELDFVIGSMRFLGCRGTTGTEASFVDLFEGDGDKVDEMNRRIAAEFGFEKCFSVSGQTYPRKADSRILNVLSSIAQSAYRMANDIRLLQHDRQVEEPFEKNQIGSSAMPSPRIMMYFICNSFIVFSKASPPTMLCASYRPRPRSHRTRKTPVPQRRPPPSSLFPAVGIEESSGRNHAAGAGAYRILAMLMISANTPAAVTLAPAP